jgi:hypothetical protein
MDCELNRKINKLIIESFLAVSMYDIIAYICWCDKKGQ